MSEVCVFLGPTLPVADARAELDAVYLPPVSAGDMFRLWQRRPKAVGIVDGYFEHVPAVWHKEIMWIMAHGVHVFGSAGLGALMRLKLSAIKEGGVSVHFVKMTPRVLQLLKITHLTDWFTS